MFLFSVSGHMDGFSKGYSNRFGWIDFTEVLEQTTDAPGVRLQRNGHNRQMVFFCQFDAECIELCWIEMKTSLINLQWRSSTINVINHAYNT